MQFDAATKLEISQLRGALNQLNIKLQSMTTTDPNQWQAVLQEYAVTASALYTTLSPDDD